MAKVAFSKTKSLFTRKMDLDLRKKTSKMLHLEHSYESNQQDATI
jgi:hypothetical protein